MKHLTTRFFAVLLTAVAIASPALSQSAYPSKPIRVIVPYPAGGVVDLFARAVTNAMAKRWSQPIVVEPRPGASSNIGTLAALRSEPNGYTWLMVGPSFTANPSLSNDAAWNPMKDFIGLGVVGYSPMIIVATEKLPVKTLRDVVELAKAKPKEITAGTMNGSSSQFLLEALKHESGVEFLMVPYAGAPPIVADLINGNVQITGLPLTVALAHIQSGRIKAIASGSASRSSLLPDVQTFAEAGYAEAALIPWYGFVAPRGTPAAIVHQINNEMNEVLKLTEVREQLLKLGAELVRPMTSADVDQLIKSDFERYSTLIKRANIKVN